MVIIMVGSKALFLKLVWALPLQMSFEWTILNKKKKKSSIDFL